jgi:hypothetical protein
MVAITAVASYALLEIDMGQVGDQLRENGSTDIHPPLFRQRRNGPRSDFRPFSVQIVFSSKAGYPADYKSLTGLCKVLYRTPVIINEIGTRDGSGFGAFFVGMPKSMPTPNLVKNSG